MNTKMLNFLTDLANVIQKHNGGLAYTIDDNGIYAIIEDDWKSKICIGFPSNGCVSDIQRVIKNLQIA